jgi:hypothetical protein
MGTALFLQAGRPPFLVSVENRTFPKIPRDMYVLFSVGRWMDCLLTATNGSYRTLDAAKYTIVSKTEA